MAARDAEPGPSPGPRGAPAAAGARAALRQIQQSARALLEQGKVDETWDFFLAALEAVLVKNRELELLVGTLRRAHRSSRSERLDPAQLSLLLEALLDHEGVPAAIDPEAEAGEDAQLAAEIKRAAQAQPAPLRKPRKTGPGWQTRGAERQEHHVAVPEAERTCAECGRAKRKIGEDLTRVLEYVPAHFVEHEYHLDKYACGHCKEGVTTAPGPAKVLDRSAADASVLAHVVVSQHADHTPLHRVNRIYARSGVELSVSTLADWTAGVGDLVAPLVDQLAARVLAAYIVRTDATGLRVLDPKSPAHIERGSIWAYVGDDRDVVFRYTKDGRRRDRPLGLSRGPHGLHPGGRVQRL